ncbi:type 1 glutamine amidotransferase family protein [Brevibacillus migulae]|uniref:type 1 glutamine amidotransferase family protein n=1 Tax=Brevibacillus migulae TaxID=1644114 RepID=UPI00106E5894|nr:type 1 glutamine amidotransferase family protein [Brevibacillus migulae]
MKEVLIFVTDGFADWEASYVSAELNKPESGYQVKTIAIDAGPKKSMGGLTVLPDYVLEGYAVHDQLAMLILPGGTGWGEEKNQQAKKLVAQCVAHSVPVAAICDATTFLGRHGFLDDQPHTGNSLPYLQANAPEYQGQSHYIEAQSVSEGNLITANGSAAVEFGKQILERLQVLKQDELEQWFAIFKHGYVQA